MDDPSISQATPSRRTLLFSVAAGVGVVLSGGTLAGGAAAAGTRPVDPGDRVGAPEVASLGAAPSVRGAIIQLGVEGMRPRGMRAVLTEAHVHSLRELVTRARTAQELPPVLQFRLRGFSEHRANDDLLNGPSDEVFLSAIGTDSSDVVLVAGGKPEMRNMVTPSFGDITENSIRGGWGSNPHVLMSFDLRHPAGWPRAFVVTLLFVEHDNGDLAEAFETLEKEVGKTIKGAVEAAAVAAAGSIVGAAIGTVVPVIGTAVGAAVGALAGGAYDVIIPAIQEGLEDEVFMPQPIQISIPDPGQVRPHAAIGKPQVLEIKEHGAHYALEYDWYLKS